MVVTGLQGKYGSPSLVLGLYCTLSPSRQDLYQALESLTSTMAALSASARKVSNRDASIQEAATMQRSYEGLLGRAKERQTELEKLLACWQR